MALTQAGTKPTVEYPSTDGEPMAQNTKQYRYITTIQGGLAAMFRDRPDVFEILSPSNTLTELLDKSLFYERYGVQEYYVYDPDGGGLYGFIRDESGHLRRVSEMQGWVSPLLGVRFALEGGELVVVRPDGARFVGYEELAAALEQAQARAEQERLLREQEQQRAERLAQKLRELGVEPD